MNIDDFESFRGEWLLAHETSSSNQAPSSAAVNKVFEMLTNYPLNHVVVALAAFGQRSRFAPTPSDIVELLEMKNKRPSANEAWVISNKPEQETVVWTEEMAKAYAICTPALNGRDNNAARMAFRDKYEHDCALAELQRKPIRWIVAEGFDKTTTAPALQAASQAGRISSDTVAKFLPPPMDAGPIGRMLTGKVSEETYEVSKKGVKKLREALAAFEKAEKRVAKKRQKEADEKRAHFEENKRVAAQLVLTAGASND